MKLQDKAEDVDLPAKGSNTAFDYILVLLMMVEPFLSSTIFDPVQVALEILLWILLIYGVAKSKLNQMDLMLLCVYGIASLGSFLLNDIHTSVLNFKISGLFVFTIIYFRKRNFFPETLIYGFLLVNILYGILAKNLNFWILESAWFFEKQDTYIYSRPVGLFGSPHSTSTFLALFFLYLVQVRKHRLLQLLILYSLYLYSSWTVVIGVVVSVVYIWISRMIRLSINPFLFLGTGLLVLFVSMEVILTFAGGVEGSRSYSLEILAPMIFDTEFYQGVFAIFPKSHDLFIAQQEKTFASVGNELGFVKVIVENGVVLAFCSFYLILKRTNFFTIFFLITLFHYSYFINMPFILYVTMIFNKEINAFLNQRKTVSGNILALNLS